MTIQKILMSNLQTYRKDDKYLFGRNSNNELFLPSGFIDENGEIYGNKQIGNQQRVVNLQYPFALNHDDVPGHTIQRVLGYNADIGDALEDMTEIGDVITKVPGGATDAAIALEVQSSNDNDTILGSGANQVQVDGLGPNWEEQSVLVDLNGQVSVEIPNKTWLRVNSFHAQTLGTYAGVAAGNITLDNVGNTETYAVITAGQNMHLGCFFTIPAIDIGGNIITQGFVLGWDAGLTATGGNTSARSMLRITADWQNRVLLPGVFLFHDIKTFNDGSLNKPFQGGIKVPPKCDIKVSSNRTQGNGTVNGYASIELMYET